MTVVALGIVTASIRVTAASVLSVGQADFTVAQKNASDILESALTETQLARVRSEPGIASAVGVLLDTERLDSRMVAFDRPAGWYPDPWHVKALRWFDGSQWTGIASDDHGYEPHARVPRLLLPLPRNRRQWGAFAVAVGVAIWIPTMATLSREWQVLWTLIVVALAFVFVVAHLEAALTGMTANWARDRRTRRAP